MTRSAVQRGGARSLSFVLCRQHDRRDLHSFPTRRSSDLFHTQGLLTARIDLNFEKCDRASWQNLYRDLRDRLAADRKSTRLNSSHSQTSYAVFCLKKKSQSSPPARTRRRP